VRRIGVVADDLTGAGDTGVQFAKRGWTTYLFSLGPRFAAAEARRRQREFAEIPVVVLNTRSRNIAPREAHRRTRLAFKVVKDREILYKKVDSTMRGNIGTELDAALEATGGERALFAAAYPAYGRVTLEGVHRVGGRQLADSEAGRDPEAPVRDSRVCQIIARQSGRSIARVDNRGFTQDPARLAGLLEEEFRAGKQVLACDALTDQDLETLARAALRTAKAPLLAGSAGLAGQLAGVLPAPGGSALPPPAAGERAGAVLVVSGSASPTNRAQLDRLAELAGTRLLWVAPEDLLRNHPAARQGRAAVRRGLGRALGQGAVVALALQPGSCPQRQPAGRLAAAFGAFAAGLLRRHRRKLKGLVLTGGETADLLLRRLGAQGLWLIREVQPGVPLARVAGGSLDGLPVVTKAGSLGSEDALAYCVRYLAEERAGGHPA
jgi:uncharacterized protein YgbK (DUF1537 family)